MSVSTTATPAAAAAPGSGPTSGASGGLVLARRRINAARDRATLSESDGGGTGRTDGND